jgi:hypothetical protein
MQMAERKNNISKKTAMPARIAIYSVKKIQRIIFR